MSRSLLRFPSMIINVSSFRSNQGQKSRRNVCCSVIIPTEKMRPPSFSISFNGNPFRHLVLMIVDAVESFLLRETPILPKTIDPKVQISGNFSPVPESPPKYKSDITGRIPDAIRGVYVRNGANPLFVPSTGHHLFDGDGMIHIVSFAGDNSVTYGCRYTLTNRLKHEMSMGRGLFPKPIGQLHGHSGIVRLLLFYALSIIGLVDISQGTGCANAGLVYFNGRLLALSEDDLPYNVKITRNGDLETNGRYDFGKQLKSNMIAHPKIDSSTGEMFALSYDPVKKPYLRYFKFDSDGTKSDEIEIPLEKPTMIHDMAITKNYVVIPDHQIVFNLSDMLSGGSPLHLDSSKTSRFGVLPKYATEASEIKWINVPGCFCFHLWNAYEESTPDSSKEIIVIGSCMSPPDSILTDREEEIKITLTEIRLNLNSDTYQIREIVKDWNLEVGHVNPMFLGRKTRFAYLAIAEPWPKCSGIAKVDLVSGKVTKFFYGNQRYGGEPEFVPIATASQIPNIVDDGDFPNANEDDGYLLSFVHDEEVGESELLIFNARNMEQEACVKLHTRVPYGFHGTFVKYEDLQNQLI